MINLVRALLCILLGVGVAVTTTITLEVTDSDACLLTIGPYLGLLALVAWPAKSRGPLTVIAIGTFILVVFGVVSFIDGFYIHLGAQSALLFLFVPLYQWIGVIAILAILGLMKWRKREQR